VPGRCAQHRLAAADAASPGARPTADQRHGARRRARRRPPRLPARVLDPPVPPRPRPDRPAHVRLTAAPMAMRVNQLWSSIAAAARYREQPGLDTLRALRRSTEGPRLELFRRMNMAPNGTRSLVRLRAELLDQLPDHLELAEVDADLHALLTSWFNPGFLSLS